MSNDIGWETINAYVDGERRPIHRVNVIFRGVWLDQGRHEVVFRYEPPSFRWGAVLSVVGLLAIAAMLWLGRRLRDAGDRTIIPR